MHHHAFPRLYPGWRRSLWRYAGLFCLCLFLVASCSRSLPPAEDLQSAPTDGRIRIGTTLKPRTLDPADAYELGSLGIIYNLGDRLYNYALDSTDLQPQLAADFPTVSEDGLTYRIPLREGIEFHDGTPFNAEAMAFSLRRFVENGGKPSFLLSDLVSEIAATGEFELTISLQQPFAAFPALLSFPGACALSPTAYEIGAGAFAPDIFVGTGPYRLRAFNSDSVRLDPNEAYWGERPANQGIDLQIYTSNPANLFNAFRTGAIDVAYQTFDPNQIANLLAGAEQGQWQAIAAPGTAVSYLVLNLQQPPLDRKPVRQALAAAIDRETIVSRVLQGQAEPIYSLLPTTFPAYEPTFERYAEGDYAEARRLLRAAGVTAAEPVQLEVWHPSGSAIRAQVATTLQAIAARELEDLVRIEPRSVESATAFSNLPQGIYPSFLVDWYPDFLDADNYIHPFLSCEAGSEAEGCTAGGARTQGSFYYSSEANELIARQREAREPESRQEILARIQILLAEDVPYIPLWQSKDYAFARSGLTGVAIGPSQSFPYSPIAGSN